MHSEEHGSLEIIKHTEIGSKENKDIAEICIEIYDNPEINAKLESLKNIENPSINPNDIEFELEEFDSKKDDSTRANFQSTSSEKFADLEQQNFLQRKNTKDLNKSETIIALKIEENEQLENEEPEPPLLLKVNSEQPRKIKLIPKIEVNFERENFTEYNERKSESLLLGISPRRTKSNKGASLTIEVEKKSRSSSKEANRSKNSTLHDNSAFMTPRGEMSADSDIEDYIERMNSCKSQLSTFSRRHSNSNLAQTKLLTTELSVVNEVEILLPDAYPMPEVESIHSQMESPSKFFSPISPQSLFSLEPRHNKIDSQRNSIERSPFINPIALREGPDIEMPSSKQFEETEPLNVTALGRSDDLYYTYKGVIDRMINPIKDSIPEEKQSSKFCLSRFFCCCKKNSKFCPSKSQKKEICSLRKIAKLRFNIYNYFHKKILMSVHHSITKKVSVSAEDWIYLGFGSTVITKELEKECSLLGLTLMLFLCENHQFEFDLILAAQKRLKNRIEIGNLAIKIITISLWALKKRILNKIIVESSEKISDLFFSISAGMMLYWYDNYCKFNMTLAPLDKVIKELKSLLNKDPSIFLARFKQKHSDANNKAETLNTA
ncbi:unnamed protein product [Blepharisma stoltei]|uniref:ELMO domain-containing protein n=1 Tax=Blepharisma stoltei TaxID=1481888 RepID=A0AAU9KAY0_9CILI|nr:unnamed protein product [Blepharisma stoltei]